MVVLDADMFEALAERARTHDETAARAFDAFAQGGLPHRRVEAFKYSDFRASLREPLKPAGDYAGPMPVADLPGTGGAMHLIIANGVVHEVPQPRPAGLRVFLEDDASLSGDIHQLPMASLAAGLTARTIKVEVEAVDGESPTIFLDRVSDHAGASGDRVALILRDGARATLVERIATGGTGLSSSLLEIGLQRCAVLERVVVHRGCGAAHLAHTTRIHLGGENRLVQTTWSDGDRLARLETHLIHQGEGCEAQMHAAYRLEGERHVDITTRTIHAVPNGTTEQITKGTVDDAARGVFQGKIDVVRDAQKTDARMSHDALLLSDRAEVNAKPELEIYADDVQCAHGNTVGALDERALFYMRQRGLSEARARELLMRAFLAEALHRLDDDWQAVLMGEALS